MKKIMMTLAAVLCCAMFMTMSMTSCTNDIGDNPVINPLPDTPDPLLKWGCNFAEVEQHIQAKQWWADGNDQLEFWEMPFQSWHKWYWVTETFTEQYLFETQDGQNLRYVICYCWDENGTKEAFLNLLHQQGFQSTGKIFYETCEQYLSADKETEALLENDEGYWNVTYMPYDPEFVDMAEVLKTYTAPQSLYKLDTKELLPFYVAVNSAYEDEQGETKFYDLSKVTYVNVNDKMFDIDASHLADNGYIKLIPNPESEGVKEMLEDVEVYGAYIWGIGVTLELINNRGDLLSSDLQITYMPRNEQKVTMDIKKADLDEKNGLLLDLPVINQFKLHDWPFERFGDYQVTNMEGFFDAQITEDDKLYVITDGSTTAPGEPDVLTLTFTRTLTGSPNPMLPDGEGLLLNFRIELELNISE